MLHLHLVFLTVTALWLQSSLIGAEVERGQSASFSFKVLNAATKQPLDSFKVLIERELLGNDSLLTKGTNGSVECIVEANSFQPQSARMFMLKVAAKGFVPWLSGVLTLPNGAKTFEIVLAPDVPLTGLVRKPDGSPADGAWITTSEPMHSFFIRESPQDDEIKPRQGLGFTTLALGTDASYRLEALPTNSHIFAEHESGYRLTTSTQLRNEREIRLESWAELAGVLKIGVTNAAAGQTVGLQSLNHNAAPYTDYRTTTDSEGRFHFQRVPAGHYQISHQVETAGFGRTHFLSKTVDIKSGQKLRVQLGGTGVRVTGRVLADRFIEIDWKSLSQVMIEGVPPSVTEPVKGGRKYAIQFEADGSFQVDDVEPGYYLLPLTFIEPAAKSWEPDSRGLMAMLRTNATVRLPTGQTHGEMSLGTLIVHVTVPVESVVLPSLVVESPEGKSLDLAVQRGHTQIVLFWAPWSEKSVATLKSFQREASALSAGSKIVTRVVAVDGTDDEIKTALASAQWQGPVCRLRGPRLPKTIELHELGNLPTVLVVDPEGRLVARLQNAAMLRSLFEITVRQISANN